MSDCRQKGQIMKLSSFPISETIVFFLWQIIRALSPARHIVKRYQPLDKNTNFCEREYIPPTNSTITETEIHPWH